MSFVVKVLFPAAFIVTVSPFVTEIVVVILDWPGVIVPCNAAFLYTSALVGQPPATLTLTSAVPSQVMLNFTSG